MDRKISLCVICCLLIVCGSEVAAATVRVVTTLPDYADLVRAIGKDHVQVTAIVRGDQDAHFIRPKPSFALALRQADLLVSTGLDLELWLQTVVDNTGNSRIRSGQEGYVAVATGMDLLEKPQSFSRSEGGVHVYGNPHITTSPINMKVAARNITQGLIKVDPERRIVYEQNAQEPFKPASNQKLITTAAALTVLPPDFTYRTILARRGNDLVMVGSGDPSIGDPRIAKAVGEPITAIFHRWADRLEADGIKTIKGDLVFDDFALDQEHVHPSWRKQHK